MASSKHSKIQVNSTVERVTVSKNFGKIITPSRMLICGPTMAGKSTFALELIKHRNVVYDQDFQRIIFALPEDSIHLHQNFLEKLRQVYPAIEIVEGLPNINELHLKDDKESKLLIIDDMMISTFASKSMLDLITKDSHHSNCSVIVTCQNIFLPTKYGRTFVRNCSEKVIFFDKTDANQLSILARQIFPRFPHFLQGCFEWIFSNRVNDPLKYILIDSSSLSHLPYNAIVRTCIFPDSHGVVRMRLFFPDKKT